MASSMTGYGFAAADKKDWSLTWEIRSVNSRFLDLKWKIPPSLYFSQGKFEKRLKKHAARGRVELFLDMRILDPDLIGMELDRTTARAMLVELKKFSREANQQFSPDINAFLRIQSLWREGRTQIYPDLLTDLEDCLERALVDWNSSRQTEGNLLLEDVQERIAQLESLLGELEELAAKNADQRFAELRTRAGRILSELDTAPDENRLLQELAFLSDRLDVSEEITRLKTHLQSLRELLDAEGEIGRKLDFLLQETFREINTCANKSQNIEMSRLAVDFKTQLEKCREQAQNLE